MKMKSVMLQVGAAAALVVGMSGCSLMKGALDSQLEVPTVEKQVNRIAMGMTVVRENNLMANVMEISGDAKWPQLIDSDLNDTQKKELHSLVADDPYYMTVKYSEPIQRQMLGSSGVVNFLSEQAGVNLGGLAGALSSDMSSLDMTALKKLEVFYGKNTANWPKTFSVNPPLGNFLAFTSGKLQLVEATDTDAYKSLDEALIALTPTNYQKDLTLAKDDLHKAQQNVADLQGQKGSLEAKLKEDDNKKSDKKKYPDYIALSDTEKADINTQLDDLKKQIEQAESNADEKETIYFNLLDNATTALKSDIKLTDKQIKLARNVNLVSKEIQDGAEEAYSAFTVAIANLIGQPLIQNLGKELQSLDIAAQRYPQLAVQFFARKERLSQNAVYALPNMFMGAYYAHAQSSLAGKYEKISGIIVEAADAKAEADRAAAEDAKKAEEEQKANGEQTQTQE